jgi:hypothetical protein
VFHFGTHHSKITHTLHRVQREIFQIFKKRSLGTVTYKFQLRGWLNVRLVTNDLSNYLNGNVLMKSRNSSVGIALGYGLDDRGSRFRFPAGAENFSLHYRVQNGSEAHPAS